MNSGERARHTMLATALATLVISHTRASRAEVVRSGYSPIVAVSTGKCLDITGASTAPGAAAIQWRCSLAPNEEWTVQPFNGSYRVIEQQTGECLSVASASTASGAQLVESTCVGSNAELWSFVAQGNAFQMVSKNSGLCANVSGNSATDGADIVQSACSNATNFLWTVSSGLMTPTTLVDLQADHSGQCLNVSGSSRSSGAKTIQWPCAGAANEQWSFVESGSAYQVVSHNSGLCLTTSSTSSGANIVQEACGTTSDRLWSVKAVGHAYQLIAQNTGLCLTVTGASQSTAAQVVQSTCSNTALNDLWSVSRAMLPSSWSGVVSLSVNPIGIANLPNGKILMWSANSEFNFEGDIGAAAGQTYTGVFDPVSNKSTEMIVTTSGADMFCPGTANLFNGQVLVNGGSSSPKTSIYDPVANAWAADAEMNIPRGYEGDTVLSTGSVLTLGGSWSGGQGGKSAELWTSGNGWHLLSGVPETSVIGPDPQGVYRGDNHLWLFSVSGGQVFHAGPSAQMHWITTTGNGTIASAGNRGDDPYAINGKAVLYDVGLILKTGGAPAYQDANATASTYVININSGVVVTKIAPMAYPRAFANGVVLPNGQVVIVGGQTFPVPFSDDTSILVPEIWDPDTRVFRQMLPMQTPRNYHSTAILLPDGRVFVGGGGQCGTGCAANHLDAEILTPPYLYNPDGTVATQPVISSVPSAVTRGGTLSVTTSSPVMSFAMMRLSSVTHSVNNDQRRIPLTIQSTSGTTSYTVAIPSDAGIALPGYYMVFALTPQGVPSTSATVLVQ